MFLEVTQKFYPAYLTFPDSETNTGQRIYYDAAFGQNSSSNVLGLVALGEQAIQYQELTGDAQKDYIVNELDDIFSLISDCENGLSVDQFLQGPICHSGFRRLN